MAGYVRNDVTDQIANGNTVDAIPLDGEFNALQAAFAGVGGHRHNGAVGEGAPITVIGPSQNVVASSNSLTPSVDNVVDLGAPSAEWKDLYIDGVANIDALVADTAQILAGTINGTTVGATTPTTVRGTTVTATVGFTGNLTGNVTGAVTGNASTATALQTPRNINGTPFNGATDIVTTNWGVARTITLGATGKSFNGGANVSWSLAEMGVGTLGSQDSGNVVITGGTISGIMDLAVADGGTGASDAAGARANLGLGTLAVQNANAVSISGGVVAGITDLAVADGGTGASDAATARTNLGAQASDPTLTALAAFNSNGLLVQTAADTFAGRVLTGTTDQVIVTNGNGGAGNPTISLSVATQAEAQAGTNNTKVMTPQRTKEALNASGAAPVYGARAWANFDGATGTIRSSGNIASIVKNGVGDYTVTFATAMPNANYAVVGSGTGVPNHQVTAVSITHLSTPTTTNFRLSVGITGGSGSPGDVRDVATVSIVVYG